VSHIMGTVDKMNPSCQLSASMVGVGNHIDCGSYTQPWFCVQATPKSEYLALLGLAELGLKPYLPQIVVRQKRYGKTEPIIRPLFPPYLFVTFQPDVTDWGLIFRTRGVQRLLVGTTGKPMALRTGEIERLQSLGRAGDGVIDDQAPAFSPIAPGASVRIAEGPFVDWTGVCQWSTEERIGVMVTLFNAERVVPMPRSAVEII
jgi:transcriptional antiterminator RfaH